ncbi:MAG: hypothetical protein Q9221_000752 [Calogaya cf. arnoldii]
MDRTSNHAAIDLRFMNYPTVKLEDNEAKICTACNKPASHFNFKCLVTCASCGFHNGEHIMGCLRLFCEKCKIFGHDEHTCRACFSCGTEKSRGLDGLCWECSRMPAARKSEDVTKDVTKRKIVKEEGIEDEDSGRKKMKTEHRSILGPVQEQRGETGGIKVKEQRVL